MAVQREQYLVATFANERDAARAVNALRMDGLPVGRIVQDSDRARAVSEAGEMAEATGRTHTLGTPGPLRRAMLGAVLGTVVGAVTIVGGTVAITAATGADVAEWAIRSVVVGPLSGATVGALSGFGSSGPRDHEARGQLLAEIGETVGFHSADPRELERARTILADCEPQRLDIATELPEAVDARH